MELIRNMSLITTTIIIIIIVLLCNQSNGSRKLNKIDKKYQMHRNKECRLPQKLLNEIKSYQPIVDDIFAQIINGKYSGDTWNSLSTFIDRFGARISGSQNLEDAIDYMVQSMNNAGLDNVHTESASVPHWVRGFESAQLIKPLSKPLPLLGLGSSIGTPRGGLIAEAIVVESFDELHQLPNDTVRGKIVVYNPKWQGYGQTVVYRRDGATEAAAKGAVASLIRSITPFSIGSPHTGWQAYKESVPKIPSACITVEDAAMLRRMYRRGDRIEISLEMEARNYPAATSRNTIGELYGRAAKVNESVVVVSGHLDSWDVGVGAMDDGGGAFISFKATEFLKKMNYTPRRTIRSILWTGEEEGIWGARAYREQHFATERAEFNFFIESDIGTFEPIGMDFVGTDEAGCIFAYIMQMMNGINETKTTTELDGGPDIDQWTTRGFPGASLMNRNDHYFWFHHSNGDSMLLERTDNLDKAAALFAAVSYVIADLSVDMPKEWN